MNSAKNRLKKSYKKMWTSALQGGDYTQCRYDLMRTSRRYPNSLRGTSFDALGVGLDVLTEDYWEIDEDIYLGENNDSWAPAKLLRAKSKCVEWAAPNRTDEWAALCSVVAEWFEKPAKRVTVQAFVDDIIIRNDDEQCSFRDIASYIQRKY